GRAAEGLDRIADQQQLRVCPWLDALDDQRDLVLSVTERANEAAVLFPIIGRPRAVRVERRGIALRLRRGRDHQSRKRAPEEQFSHGKTLSKPGGNAISLAVEGQAA